MTLDELDKKIDTEPKVTVFTPSASSESHQAWTKRRSAEDAALKDHKCPLCSADVTITVLRGTSYYTCTRNVDHRYSRFFGIGVVTPSVMDEYSEWYGQE